VAGLLSLVLSLALSGCQHGPAGGAGQDPGNVAGPERNRERPWLTVTTAHFEVFSQLDEANTAGLVQILERTRSALLAAAWPLTTRLPASPVRVVAVWDLVSFGGARPGSFGGLATWSAGIRELGRTNLIMIDLDSETPQEAGFTAAHELAHLILHLLEVDRPLWLDEGLASYFEAMVFETEHVTVGAVPASRMPALRTLTRVPMTRLFEWPVPAEDYESYSVFTKNSFLLIHYLMSEHHQRFRDFQRRLLEGVPWRSAWEQQFGPLDQLALDEQVTAYWQRRRWPTRDYPVSFAAERPVHTSLLPPADVHALRAILYQRTRGPASPDERRTRSLAEVRRSLAIDPVGRLSLEAGWPDFTPDEARSRARATWRARPDDWRAAVLASAADPKAAVDILEATLRRRPRHSYLQGALALAYWGVQRHADARQLAREAAEREPGDPYLLGVYGQCLIAQGACEAGRQRIADALARWVMGERFPYDLDWLTQTCGVQ
jgi:hypothetical protein